MHRPTARLANQRTSEDMLCHFAECSLALFKQASYVSIHTTTGGRDAQPVVFDQHGDKLYMPILRSIGSLVLNGGEAVSFVDSDANLSDSDSLQCADVRAGLCTPLLAEDRTFGFVQIDCRGSMLGSFSEGDIQILAVMTHQQALAMYNLRLQEELQNSVTKLQLAKTKMEQLAFVDPLTSLSNRRLFLHQLEHSVESARRASTSFCLLYPDLDVR
jgi:predicted signal transduction protein with EAL and GGDEF domain